ncbi:MAG: hypothetical protein D6826_02195, partial [Alphaproteobacteria bacterium]
DPLPFPSEAGRAGGFGVIVATAVDPAHPAAAVLAALRSLDVQPPVYGRLESPGRFVRHQIRMQLRKRGWA